MKFRIVCLLGELPLGAVFFLRQLGLRRIYGMRDGQFVLVNLRFCEVAGAVNYVNEFRVVLELSLLHHADIIMPLLDLLRYEIKLTFVFEELLIIIKVDVLLILVDHA